MRLLISMLVYAIGALVVCSIAVVLKRYLQGLSVSASLTGWPAQTVLSVASAVLACFLVALVGFLLFPAIAILWYLAHVLRWHWARICDGIRLRPCFDVIANLVRGHKFLPLPSKRASDDIEELSRAAKSSASNLMELEAGWAYQAARDYWWNLLLNAIRLKLPNLRDYEQFFRKVFPGD